MSSQQKVQHLIEGTIAGASMAQLESDCKDVDLDKAMAVAFSRLFVDGYFRPGRVMDHMNRLIRDGISFDTQQYTEIGPLGSTQQ